MGETEHVQSKIDELDEQLVRLLQQRMTLSEQVTELKLSDGGRLLDRRAEELHLDRLEAMGESEFERHAIRQMIGQLQSISHKRQYQMMRAGGTDGRLPFIMVDRLDTEDIRVAYQGVDGAYSHLATKSYFGEQVNCFHVEKFRDAMEAIADGVADYAVLPIENSTAGIVADNYDLLMEFENFIVGEQVVRCEHVLMGLPEAELGDIDTVYSHPQALAQCEQYLNSHPDWHIVPFGNTALAARKVAEDGIVSHAAIGSAFAARHFGLRVLREHVYFNEANSTRFIVVCSQRIFRKDARKISISFEVPHRTGSLYEILAQFTYNGLNLSRIESRPIPDKNWEYRFFIDFDGNLASSSVKSALRGLRREAVNLKIIGNY